MSKKDEPTTVDEVELPDPNEILDELNTAEPDVKPKEEPKDKPKDDEDEKEEPTEAEKPEPEPKEPEESAEEGKPDEEAEAKEPESEPEGDKEVKQRGYAERRELKQKVTTGLAEKPEYTPQTASELEEGGMDPALAGIEALRQEVRRDQIINELTELNASVNNDANTVLREYPVYDPTSKDYDKDFATKVENLYKKYANFQVDEQAGYITRADLPLGEFFAFAAQARGTGSARAEVQGQKAAEKMLASSEEPSSAPEPAKAKEDTDEDALFLAGLKGEKGTYAQRSAKK